MGKPTVARQTGKHDAIKAPDDLPSPPPYSHTKPRPDQPMDDDMSSAPPCTCSMTPSSQLDRTMIWGDHQWAHSILEAMTTILARRHHRGSRHHHHRLRLTSHLILHQGLVSIPQVPRKVIRRCRPIILRRWGSCLEWGRVPPAVPGSQWHSQVPAEPARPQPYDNKYASCIVHAPCGLGPPCEMRTEYVSQEDDFSPPPLKHRAIPLSPAQSAGHHNGRPTRHTLMGCMPHSPTNQHLGAAPTSGLHGGAAQHTDYESGSTPVASTDPPPTHPKTIGCSLCTSSSLTPSAWTVAFGESSLPRCLIFQQLGTVNGHPCSLTKLGHQRERRWLL